MASESINSPVSIDLQAILDGIARLDIDTLESFAERVNTIVAQKKSAHLPKREAELIRKINEGLPDEIQRRYRILLSKAQEETLTEEEHEEMLELVPVVESKDAERLEYLVELAQVRGSSVDEVMKQLGITPPSHVQ